MYRESSGILLTGDVVHFELADFEKIVRHPSMLEVFKQFETDSKYKSKLWAILNKPCDMVHDSSGRRFKNNLFLAPLLGFKVALKTGVLGFFPHQEEGPNAYKAFIEAYKKYLQQQAFETCPKEKDEKQGDYIRRIQTAILTPILTALESKVEDLKEDGDDPNDILQTLKDKTAPGSAPHTSIVDFEQSTAWMRAKERFQTQADEAVKLNKKIVIPKDKSVIATLSSLCLNQMDSSGIFFYEPDPRISNVEYDLAYLIQLENLLTIKISNEMIESGQLVQLLTDKRRVLLDENFSDRLLNIMGNFFSKIGTGDVLVDDVLETYIKVYPDEFVFGVD